MMFVKNTPVIYDVIKLEIHASHACNLTCESCSHFSNGGHKGILSPADADKQMGFWSHRLNPYMFSILGGEPLLNPKIKEIAIIVRKHWKNRIEFVTNGLLFPKHPGLGQLLNELEINIVISQHSNSNEYVAQLEKAKKSLEGVRYFMRDVMQQWTRRYKGYGPNIMPYEDNSPETSWEICNCKFCLQILDGELYKCPTIAYLRIHKQRWPGISPKWDRYLQYKPLAPTATDEELKDFISRKHESICEMCPSKSEYFEKSSPLITVGELLARIKK